MEGLTESAFEKSAAELFSELEERVKKLEVLDPVTKQIRNLILESKDLLDAQKIKESLEKYQEARISLEGAEISSRANPLAKRLFVLEIVYLLTLLAIAYATYKWPCLGLWKGLVSLDTKCIWFGALGGVTIGLYGVYSHVSTRDFDPKYRLWYVAKPFIGGIFGWFAYLVYYIGLVSIQGFNSVNVKTPEAVFIIAFLAGFNERFAVKLVDRLLMILTTWQETTEGTAGKKQEGKVGKAAGK